MENYSSGRMVSVLVFIVLFTFTLLGLTFGTYQITSQRLSANFCKTANFYAKSFAQEGHLSTNIQEELIKEVQRSSWFVKNQQIDIFVYSYNENDGSLYEKQHIACLKDATVSDVKISNWDLIVIKIKSDTKSLTSKVSTSFKLGGTGGAPIYGRTL